MQEPIVVIDDERGVLDLLRQVLEDEGLQVMCLDHPRQTGGLHTAVRPRLFLIDLMLPGRNGIELARELHARSFSQVPMIAMSASSSMAREARATGLFRDTINKPFDLDHVVETVERYIVSRRP